MQKLPVSACVGALVLVLVALGAYAFGFIPGGTLTPTAPSTPATTDGTRTVRWLLAHEPIDVYTRAIRVFAEELEKESNGRMRLEAVTPRQVGIQEYATHPEIVELLDTGAVDIASTYGVANGHSDERFWAWQLPFLFENYEEVEAAFNGPAAEALLRSLEERSTLHPLAYTLSGGFRILASPQAINAIEDLRGMNIATAGRPVAEATLRAFGAEPILLQDGSRLVGDEADAIETTYARLKTTIGDHSRYTQNITETNHSLFLTTVVASKLFYDSLTPEDQQALQRAARAAAAVERADAIALNDEVKAQLQATGSVIRTLTPEERSALVAATRGVYDEFASTFEGFVPGN